MKVEKCFKIFLLSGKIEGIIACAIKEYFPTQTVQQH